MAKHHSHAHHKKHEPKPKLRKFAAPITLVAIFVYAAQWAVRTRSRNIAAGIAIAGAAAVLWILYPRKGR